LLPLVGATSREALARVEAPARLVRRYGVEAPLVSGADPKLNEPIVDGLPYTAAELRFGVTHEGAHDVGDLLDRRTRIGLVAGDRKAAEKAAKKALKS
jgi:glycerol-3-phosphate dehydrogenase